MIVLLLAYTWAGRGRDRGALGEQNSKLVDDHLDQNKKNSKLVDDHRDENKNEEEAEHGEDVHDVDKLDGNLW